MRPVMVLAMCFGVSHRGSAPPDHDTLSAFVGDGVVRAATLVLLEVREQFRGQPDPVREDDDLALLGKAGHPASDRDNAAISRLFTGSSLIGAGISRTPASARKSARAQHHHTITPQRRSDARRRARGM